MPTLVLFLFRFARFLFSGHAALAVENAALRLQLDTFLRKRQRPVLTSLDAWALEVKGPVHRGRSFP